MGSFVAYIPVIPEEKNVIETIQQLETWFQDNPDRETCSARLWSGADVTVRKEHVEEDARADIKTAKQLLEKQK